MTNSITISKKSPGDDWNIFVQRHPLGTIYHTSEWMDVIEQSFKHITGYLITIRNKRGEIIGGLPVYFVNSWLIGRRLVSAPFALYCDPLLSDPSDLDLIFAALMDLYKSSKSRYIELRAATTIQSNLIKLNFAVSRSYKTHNLKLDQPPEHLLKYFHRNTACSLRRAFKSNIGLRYGEKESDLLIFYRMLRNSRKRIGLPPIPYKFFKTLWDVFKPLGKLDLLLAVADGEFGASKLLLKHRDTVFFEYGCDVIEFRKRRINHFLEWEAIKMAYAQGYRKYNFGRTSITNHGLLDYKKRWGSKESDLPKFIFPKSYGKRHQTPELSLKYRIARKVFKKVPRNIAMILGEFLYRHMG